MLSTTWPLQTKTVESAKSTSLNYAWIFLCLWIVQDFPNKDLTFFSQKAMRFILVPQ